MLVPTTEAIDQAFETNASTRNCTLATLPARLAVTPDYFAFDNFLAAYCCAELSLS
jgi:hypothetical protein